MARWTRCDRAGRHTDKRSGGRGKVRKTGAAAAVIAAGTGDRGLGTRSFQSLVPSPQSLLRRPLGFHQPEEELLAVGKGNVPADGAGGTVLCLEAIDGDHGSSWQRFLRQPE